MIFNSVVFLFAFLPVTYFGFWSLRAKAERHAWLALTGYVFYGAWNWRFCGLMAFSTLVAFSCGRALVDERLRRWRRALLWGAVAVDLSLLGFFKYANFAAGALSDAARLLGTELHFPVLDVVLPVGISFYTFHTLTYVVDVYRGRVEPTRSLAEFACYVSFFAQLVAGPIVRFRQIEGDLHQVETARPSAAEAWGSICLGMAKKVLLADALARQVDPLLAGGAVPPFAAAWLALLGYAYQLYFDFSGYSDMAVGLGLLFGLRLPKNFDSPYRATSPSDFWRRWHMSLSGVLRDYVYVPLGGNADGPLRTARNLLVTMLLGGLWHGANWTFVLWGLFHGLLLVLFRAVGDGWARLPSALQRTATFVLVVFGWALFRAATVSQALGLWRALLTPAWPQALPSPGLLALVVGAGALAHLGPNVGELKHPLGPRLAWLAVAGFALALVGVLAGAYSPFLYFQF